MINMKTRFLISHRGNTSGPNPLHENNPQYINQTLSLRFDVEIDVWLKNDQFFLGHDEPTYKVSLGFFNSRHWIHCKNIEALSVFNSYGRHYNYFFHDKDPYTLTSKGFIWAYPGEILTERSILVMPERSDFKDLGEPYLGVCSDFIADLKKKESL